MFITLIFLLSLFISTIISIQVTFNGNYNVYTGNKYIDFIKYDFELQNNYSNAFILFDTSGKFSQYCIQQCSGVERVNTVLKNITVLSNGPTTMIYQLNIIKCKESSSSSSYDEIIYAIIGIISGIIIIALLSLIIWCLLRDKYYWNSRNCLETIPSTS